jgi:glyoxalase family protein
VQLASLHHVTCVCADAQRTVDFYRDRLGFRLVKKTVNFDDPHSYHLYFGDEHGAPGTLLTFFEWPRSEGGRVGRGTLASIAIESPYADEPATVEDPDGLILNVFPGDAPRVRSVVALGNPVLYAGILAADAPIQFGPPTDTPALIGAGTTHHVAWRVEDDAALDACFARLTELGLRPTGPLDRTYFRSVYFRMPDGLLHEVATAGPGFAVDEPARHLGEELSLPAWLEEARGTLERELAPIR